MKFPAFLLVSLVLSTAVTAQPFELDKFGGAAPGTTTFSMSGTPGELYLLIVGLSETQHVTPSGQTLDVSLDLLSVSLTLPGFFGVLDGAGQAGATLQLPNTPALLDLTLSLQAIEGDDVHAVSNLVRVTPQAPGTFASTLGDPTLPITGGAVAVQADGRLQLIGGSGPAAQVYDADLEEFVIGGVTFGVGILSQATALADGRILFTGGLAVDGQPTAASAVYDPSDESTTEISMLTARAGHGATLLGDGTILITGGFAALDLTDILALFGGLQASSEIFDPGTLTFSSGPAMLEPRALHTSTPLNDGRALVAGGLTLIPIVNIPTVSGTAYEYNPQIGTFGFPKIFAGARLAHSSTLLDDGRVMLCGGLNLDFTDFITTLDPLDLALATLDDCQVYSPGLFGGFNTVSGLSSPRAGAGMIALPGNGALIVGGFNLVLDPNDLLASEFAPKSEVDLFQAGALTTTGSMQDARIMPVLHTLADGTILVLGGGVLGAEVYQR